MPGSRLTYHCWSAGIRVGDKSINRRLNTVCFPSWLSTVILTSYISYITHIKPLVSVFILIPGNILKKPPKHHNAATMSRKMDEDIPCNSVTYVNILTTQTGYQSLASTNSLQNPTLSTVDLGQIILTHCHRTIPNNARNHACLVGRITPGKAFINSNRLLYCCSIRQIRIVPLVRYIFMQYWK